jgi:hypothetical protein
MYFQVPNYRHGEKQTETIHDWTIAVILDSREFSLFFNFYQILIAFNKLKIISEEETDYVFFYLMIF